MSFDSFGQLPNFMKKAIYEKKNSFFFVRKQRENELSSMQSRLKIFFS